MVHKGGRLGLVSKLVPVFSSSVVNVVVRFLPFPVKGAVVAPSVDGAVDAAVVTLALIGLFLVGISNGVLTWEGKELHVVPLTSLTSLTEDGVSVRCSLDGSFFSPCVLDGSADRFFTTASVCSSITSDPSIPPWFGLSLTPTEETCEVNGRLVNKVKRPISVSAETPVRKAIVAKRWTTISRRETAGDCCIVLFFKFVRVNLSFGVWCLCLVFVVFVLANGKLCGQMGNKWAQRPCVLIYFSFPAIFCIGKYVVFLQHI